MRYHQKVKDLSVTSGVFFLGGGCCDTRKLQRLPASNLNSHVLENMLVAAWDDWDFFTHVTWWLHMFGSSFNSSFAFLALAGSHEAKTWVILKWRTWRRVASPVWCSSSGCSACVWSLIDFVKLGVAEGLNFFSLPRVDESVLAVLSAVQECHRYPITKLLRLLRTGSDWIRRYPKYFPAKAFNDVESYEVLTDRNTWASSSSGCTTQGRIKSKWSRHRCHCPAAILLLARAWR